MKHNVAKRTQRFIEKSPTRTKLAEIYPYGSHVTIEEIERAYCEHTTSKKPVSQIRARGRLVYLRLVDEGFWVGDTTPYIRVKHGDGGGVFEWARLDSIHLGRGIRRVKGKTLRYSTVSGNLQAIGIDKVHNLAEVVAAAEQYVKAASR